MQSAADDNPATIFRSTPTASETLRKRMQRELCAAILAHLAAAGDTLFASMTQAASFGANEVTS